MRESWSVLSQQRVGAFSAHKVLEAAEARAHAPARGRPRSRGRVADGDAHRDVALGCGRRNGSAKGARR